MGNIGFPEMLVIFVIALLIFGPKRLPDLGKSLGKGLSEFRRASNDLKNTIEREINTANLEDVIKGNPVSKSEKTRVDDSKS
jgi:sec-independent protein translocase protein TatA